MEGKRILLGHNGWATRRELEFIRRQRKRHEGRRQEREREREREISALYPHACIEEKPREGSRKWPLTSQNPHQDANHNRSLAMCFTGPEL